MLRFVITSLFILLISQNVLSQEKEVQLVKYKIVGNDTVPYVVIDGVEVFDFKIFKTKRQTRRNIRLIRNVKKVYPWAKLAGRKLKEYEIILSGAETEREKRKIMKQVEQDIHDEYGSELKKLTISQGKILIKLIDRETRNTSFDLVKDFRGGFAAFFYQSFARLFGYNLKTKYDPNGEDRNIEIIVRMIENGVI
ncbi:MAG: hypothetical protein B6D64_02635 [Bacteroidetes bacterium 4484_276]|nr:MAG: hypothetical protein B6D64_02635 [Bacteroidetes bacterium 4484_276]